MCTKLYQGPDRLQRQIHFDTGLPGMNLYNEFQNHQADR